MFALAGPRTTEEEEENDNQSGVWEHQASRNDESRDSQVIDGIEVDAKPSRLGAEGIWAEGTGAEGCRADGVALQADANGAKQPKAVQAHVQYDAAGYDPAWLLLFAVQVSTYASCWLDLIHVMRSLYTSFRCNSNC